jgi:ABC-type bacteriocin/lantibiotic exporter with double-glycine peptidase domain
MRSNFNQAFIKFLRLLKLERDDIVVIYWMAAIGGIIYLTIPLAIQSIVSFVMSGSISTSIIVLVLSVIIGVFLNGYLQIRQLEIIEKIEQKVFVRYAFSYSERLPLLDLQKNDNYYLPEMVNRFFDVANLQKSIYKLLLEIPTAILQILIGTILLAFYHPIFIGFGLVLLILVVLIIYFTSPMGFTSAMNTSDYKYLIGDWFEQISRNIKLFKYNSHHDFHMRRTDELVNQYIRNKTIHFRILKTQYWSLIIFKILVFSAMLFLGVSLLVDQEINIGQFIAADIVIIGMIGSIEKFINNFDKLYEALTSIEKLEKISLAPLEVHNSHHYKNSDGGMRIKFDNVGFSYNQTYKVFSDLSFELEKGDWMQIKGDRKSGKTSVLNLISGSYSDYEGTITINELPLNNYNLSTLRRKIGVLFQSNYLIEGTVLENICMHNHQPDMDEVLKIAKVCGLWKYLNATKEGFSLKVHPYRNEIPSAFVNAILLSRAVYGDPDLILLEDPFTSMTKQEIDEFVHYIRGKHNPTVIIVDNTNDQFNFCNKEIYLSY